MLKSIGKSKFVLGSGLGASYTDLEIEVEISEKPEIKILEEIEHPDTLLIEQVIKQISKWIKSYEKNSIYLLVTIRKIGFDSNRVFDVKGGVALAFYDALPKLGIEPPQIFTY